MIILEYALKMLLIFFGFYLWHLALLLGVKLIFKIPGSAFSRDKQRKFDGGDDLNET